MLITRYCPRMDGSVDKQRVMWDSSWVSEGVGCGGAGVQAGGESGGHSWLVYVLICANKRTAIRS